MSDEMNPGTQWQPGGGPPMVPPAFGPPGSPPPAPPLTPTPALAPHGFPQSYGTPVPVVPHAPKRSKGKVITGVVAVTALLAGGAFALTKITGNDSTGGAASPVEVGTSLTTALAQEDALGVVDLLLPGERSTFRQPLIDFIDNLKRLEVLDGKASLGNVGGLDIEFANVEVTADETNAKDITNIVVTGDSTVSIDGSAVPIGDLLVDEAFGGDRPDMDGEPQDEAVSWSMTTVERGGRWYLSLFYSIAEQSRSADTDIPEKSIRLNGAKSPEGAVDNLLQAISDLDLEGLLGTLNPNEAEALHRYAPMFIADGQRSVDDAGVAWKINDTDFKVAGKSDRRSVSISNLHFEGRVGDSPDIVADYDGKCFTTIVDGDKTSTCGDNSSIDDVIESLESGGGGQLATLFNTLNDAFKDYDGSAITVEKVGGKWYVSPLGSTFDLLTSVLQSLDKSELTDIIDAFKEASSSLSIDDLSLPTDDSVLVDPFPTDTIVPTDTVPFDTVPFDTVPGDTLALDPSAEAITACYSSPDSAAAVQCFQDGISAGVIDPTYLSVEYRFPECNAAEMYWSGDIYSLSDADFMAFVTGVSPCFQQKVADGVVEYYWLQTELWAPECLEDKNWYSNSDPDYTTRVFECAGKKVP